MKLHGKPVYWWLDRFFEPVAVNVILRVPDDSDLELWQLGSDRKELEKCFQWMDEDFNVQCTYRSQSELDEPESQEWLDAVHAKVFIPWYPELGERVLISYESQKLLDRYCFKFDEDLVNAASFIAFSWMDEDDPKEIHVKEHHVEKAFKLLHTPFTPGTIDWRDICTQPWDESMVEMIREDPEFAKALIAESVDSRNEEGGKNALIRLLMHFMKAYE